MKKFSAWKDLEEDDDEYEFIDDERIEEEEEEETSDEEEELKRQVADEEEAERKRQVEEETKAERKRCAEDCDVKETPLKQCKLNRKDITPIIEAAARVGTTERQTIAIVNAAKESDGVDLRANPSECLSKAKYHKASGSYLSKKSEEAVPPTNCLFFDGKKSNTKTEEVVDDDFTRKTEKVQDHYVVTDATRESYVGEFTPEDRSGPGIEAFSITSNTKRGSPKKIWRQSVVTALL